MIEAVTAVTRLRDQEAGQGGKRVRGATGVDRIAVATADPIKGRGWFQVAMRGTLDTDRMDEIFLVPHQATFALSTTARRRRSS
ncbi:hypothetical protein, partial [Planomonospora parontospora]|uniref:hypothetical protein n=1 Tax=Planomonospora parontospora TaxID=58119 RepID=UPI001E4307E0